MRQIAVTGILVACSPVCHCGKDDRNGSNGKNNEKDTLFKLPVLTMGETKKGEGFARFTEVYSISPNHFRSALRDACAEVVWEKLPEKARDLYAYRLLFSGGFQQEKKKKGNGNGNENGNGEESEEGKKLNASPLETLNYLQRNLFMDLWGGSTQIDNVLLVPSRVKTFIAPIYKETRYLWESRCQVRIEKIRDALDASGFSGPLSSVICASVENPPYCPKPVEVLVTVRDNIDQKLVEKYRKFYELDEEFLDKNKTLKELLKGSNLQTIKALPLGVSFLCTLQAKMNDFPEDLQKLETGCLIKGLERFGRSPVLGGKTAMGMGVFSGVFLVELMENGEVKEDGYIFFDGVSEEVQSTFKGAPFLAESAKTFEGMSPEQACLFLDPGMRPKKLMEQIKKAEERIKEAEAGRA